MKNVILLVAFIGLSSVGFSQTKKIAHRSHSGKASSFSINGADNFGTTPEMEEAKRKKELERARLDSIARKAVADSLAKVNKKPPMKKVKVKNKKKNDTDSVAHH